MQEDTASKLAQYTAQFKARPATAADDQALLDLIGVPLTTRGVMLSFQRQPSYFNAAKVVYSVNDHYVIEEIATGKLVACCSNGYRPCYVNGEIKPLRYACDLRINPTYRGAYLMKMVGDYMGATMHDPDYNHIIIFDDNVAAKKAVHTGRAGIPDYYEEGLIETLTLTGMKNRKALAQYIQNSQSSIDLGHLKVVTAQEQHVSLMNQFIAKMAGRYNFIPAYDFNDLIAKTDYYQGLNIDDFQLYFYQDQLVGMFGLWSQSGFKQTTILDYGHTVGVLRPFYNIWTRIAGGMKLPKKGNYFKYHVLHTLLCEPEQLGLHDRMLNDAYTMSKQRGVGVISYTLSHKDPRQKLNQFYQGELLTGIHGFLCNTHDPRVDMDVNRIPYLEVGRI